MNLAQLTGLIRAFIAAISGLLIGRGISSDQITHGTDAIIEIVGAVGTLLTMYWSWRSNHPSNLAAQLATSNKPLSQQVTGADSSKKDSK